MKTKIINVIREFHPDPDGRYDEDGDGNGQKFRQKFLAPSLRDESYQKVIVDLNGSSRYGPSFIDEAFGGLIRYEGFKFEILQKKLEIVHDQLASVVSFAWERIEKANADSLNGNNN